MYVYYIYIFIDLGKWFKVRSYMDMWMNSNKITIWIYYNVYNIIYTYICHMDNNQGVSTSAL